MNPASIPVVGRVFEMGASDPVFDSLLLGGPVVVLLIALLGRTPIVQALAIGYIVSFLAKIAHNFIRSSATDS